MSGDDVWLGVKSQTNLEIAGSPRNIFRDSLYKKSTDGRALTDLGGFTAYRSLSNSEYQILVHRESDSGR